MAFLTSRTKTPTPPCWALHGEHVPDLRCCSTRGPPRISCQPLSPSFLTISPCSHCLNQVSCIATKWLSTPTISKYCVDSDVTLTDAICNDSTGPGLAASTKRMPRCPPAQETTHTAARPTNRIPSCLVGLKPFQRQEQTLPTQYDGQRPFCTFSSPPELPHQPSGLLVPVPTNLPAHQDDILKLQVRQTPN